MLCKVFPFFAQPQKNPYPLTDLRVLSVYHNFFITRGIISQLTINRLYSSQSTFSWKQMRKKNGLSLFLFCIYC